MAKPKNKQTEPKSELTRVKKYTKSNLPEKTCPVCQRPFAWRKKWERCWDEVIYCSKRCQSNKNKIQ